MRPAKLLKQHEDLLCRAHDNGNRVVGASYKAKEALVYFGYAKCTGINQSGYDTYILTDEGIVKAAELAASRQVVITKETPNPDEIKARMAILDDIIEVVTDPEVMTKTITFPNGAKARFDRSGPNKIVIQINKLPEDKRKS